MPTVNINVHCKRENAGDESNTWNDFDWIGEIGLRAEKYSQVYECRGGQLERLCELGIVWKYKMSNDVHHLAPYGYR